jgi:hypothetical protein
LKYQKKKGGKGKKTGEKKKNRIEYFFSSSPNPLYTIYIYFFFNSYMIHIELGPSTIVGLGLIVVGLLLYALRIREPNVSRGVFLDVPYEKGFK